MCFCDESIVVGIVVCRGHVRKGTETESQQSPCGMDAKTYSLQPSMKEFFGQSYLVDFLHVVSDVCITDSCC